METPEDPLPPDAAGGPGSRRTVLIVTAAVVALVLVVLVGALVLGGGDSDRSEDELTSRAGEANATTTTQAAVDAVTPAAGDLTGEAAGGNRAGSGSSGPAGPAAPVRFASVSIPSTYDCKKAPTFKVSWAAENAGKVDVYVDGGLYASYGPSGSINLAANCNDTQAVRIVAYGTDGSEAEKSVTAADVSAGAGSGGGTGTTSSTRSGTG